MCDAISIDEDAALPTNCGKISEHTKTFSGKFVIVIVKKKEEEKKEIGNLFLGSSWLQKGYDNSNFTESDLFHFVLTLELVVGLSTFITN